MSITLNQTNTILATSGNDETVRLWNLQTGTLLKRLIGYARYVAFSPDGKTLATGGSERYRPWEHPSSSNSVKLWDVSSGKLLNILEGHNSAVCLLAFSKDSNTIISGSKDGIIKFWDRNSGDVTATLNLKTRSEISALAVNPDETMLAICTGDNNITIYNILNSKRIMTLHHAIISRFADVNISVLSFSPDGRFLATGGTNDTVQVWSVAPWKKYASLCDAPKNTETSGTIDALCFSPDSSYLATNSWDSSDVAVWNIAKQTKVSQLTGNRGRVLCLAYDQKGSTLISGDTGRLITQWDLSNGTVQRTIEGNYHNFTAVAYDSNTNILASGEQEGIIRLWNASNGFVASVLSKHKAPITSLAFSPNGNWLASGDERGGIVLWNCVSRNTGRALTQPIKKDLYDECYVGFTSDGNTLISANREQVILWDVATGTEREKLSIHGGYLAVGHDNDLVAVASFEGIVFWSLAKHSLLKSQLLKSLTHVSTLAFSLDGSKLITGDFDGYIKLWNISDGKLLKTLRPHQNEISSIVLSDDGRLIASASRDQTINLMNFPAFSEVQAFKGHIGAVRSVTFGQKSSWIASAGDDATIKIWNLKTDKNLVNLVPFEQQKFAIITDDGQFDTDNFEGLSDINWVLADEPLTPFPLIQFYRDFYHPNLLMDSLTTNSARTTYFHKPLRALQDLNRARPTVKITDIQFEPEYDPWKYDTVSVTIEVSGGEHFFERDGKQICQQTGIYDLRLFRAGQLVGQYPDVLDSHESEIKLGASSELILKSWQDAHLIGLDTLPAPHGVHQYVFHNIRLPHNHQINGVEFTAYAFNSDRIKSETSRKILKTYYLRHMIPHAYLICMGVNAYQDNNWDLDFAANGATDILKFLTDKLSATRQYEVVPVSLISDYEEGTTELAHDHAKKADLKQALAVLAGKATDPTGRLKAATPDDLVFVYIASHGYAAPDGTFYIVPYDIGVPTGVSEDLLNAAFKNHQYPHRKQSEDFLHHCISSEELTEWLQRVDAGQTVLVLDSCHSAGVTGRDFRPGPLGDRGFGQLAYDKAMRVLVATQEQNVAIGTLKLKHSLLADALLYPLQGEQPFEMKEWLSQTKDKVPTLYKTQVTGLTGESQQPVLLDFVRLPTNAVPKN